MPRFLHFLAAVIGVLSLLAALGAFLAPGLGLPMAVGIVVGALSLVGLLAGIAGIDLAPIFRTRGMLD
jgi:hypothetical protein